MWNSVCWRKDKPSPFHWNDPRRIIIVLKTYYDSSGTYSDPRQKFVSLAGVVSSAPVWKKFENRWNKILFKHKAQYFHCNEAWGLAGEFDRSKGWDCTKVNRLFSDLMKNTKPFRNKLRLWGQLCTIEKNSYKCFKEAAPDIVPIECVCVGNCVGTVLAMSDQKPRCIELFFDRNEPFSPHIMDYWKESKDNSNHPLAWVGHIDDRVEMRTTPGIQLADIMAWVSNRQRTIGDCSNWQDQLQDSLSFHRDEYVTEFDLKYHYHRI